MLTQIGFQQYLDLKSVVQEEQYFAMGLLRLYDYYP